MTRLNYAFAIIVLLVGPFVVTNAAEPDRAVSDQRRLSPQVQLLKAVRMAEFRTASEKMEKTKVAITMVALSVIQEHTVEAIHDDKTNWGDDFDRVEVRGDVIVVTGHNYWWTLRAVIKNDRLVDVEIQASPICLE